MTDDAGSGPNPTRLPVTAEQWRPYLTEYSDWFLRLTGLTVEDTVPLVGLSAEQVSARWLGYEPATEEMIAATEERLGVRLPPSLRGFLLASNGWGAMVSQGADVISSCDEIDWFRNTHPGFFPDEDELAERGDRHVYTIFARCLNVTQGAEAFLLDTGEVSSADGEYDSYLFAIKYGTLESPCKSFSELIALGREEVAGANFDGNHDGFWF
jgi:SMI1 / KNR4 family (SUKH-1)